MASKSLGTLTVNLIAEIGGFVAGMTKAERAAEKSSKDIAKRKKQLAKDIDESFKAIGQGMALAFTAAAAAATAAFAGISVAISDTVNKGKEMQILAQISGTTVGEFQRLAAAASSVGIPAEKLGDIFKDMQDRVGDFATTGGGPLLDFFEQIGPKVGVTIADFQRLSGPEALQLFADSLTKAGVNANQFAFYMEAVASDSTKLIPLLQDGGAAFDELGQAAADNGAIMSDSLMAAIDSNREAMAGFDQSLAAIKNTVSAELLPIVNEVITQFNAWWKEGENVEKASKLIRDGLELLWDKANRAMEIFYGFRGAMAKVSGAIQFLSMNLAHAVTQLANLGRTGAAAIKAILTGDISALGDAIKSGLDNATRNLQVAVDSGLEIAADTQAKVDAMQVKAEAARDRIGNSPFQRIRNMNEALGQQRAAQEAVTVATRQTEGVARTLANTGAKASKAAREQLSEEQKAIQRMQEEYKNLMQSMKERLEMIGATTEAQKVAVIVNRGYFSEEQQRLIEYTDAQKEAAIALAEQIDLREEQYNQQKKLEDQAKQQQEDAARTLEDLDHEILLLGKTREEQEQINLARSLGNALTDEHIEKLKKLHMAQALDGVSRDLQDMQHEITLLGKTRDEQERLNFARRMGIAASTEQGQAALKALESFQRLRKEVDQNIEIADTLRDSFATAFKDFATGAKSFKDALTGMLDQINDKIWTMISENVTQSLFGEFGSSIGGGNSQAMQQASMDLKNAAASIDFSSDSSSQALNQSATNLNTSATAITQASQAMVQAAQAIRASGGGKATGGSGGTDNVETDENGKKVVRTGPDTSADAKKAANKAAKSADDIGTETAEAVATGFWGKMMSAFGGIFGKVGSFFSNLFGGGGGGSGGGGIFSWIAGLFSGGGGGGGGMNWLSMLGGLFGGGMASGGRALPGMFYEVNEKGPELMTVHGRDYLMTGRSGATITPNHALPRGGSMAQTNNFILQGRVDRRTQQQIAMDVGRESSKAARRNS